MPAPCRAHPLQSKGSCLRHLVLFFCRLFYSLFLGGCFTWASYPTCRPGAPFVALLPNCQRWERVYSQVSPTRRGTWHLKIKNGIRCATSQCLVSFPHDFDQRNSNLKSKFYLGFKMAAGSTDICIVLLVQVWCRFCMIVTEET